MKKLPEKPAAALAINTAKFGGHRFMPGQSGNPSGRPKTAHISQALRQKLDSELEDGSGRSYAQAIADRLCHAAVYAKRESQAVQAAAEIADRVEGKAVQAVVQASVIDENTSRRIADLAERFAPLLAGKEPSFTGDSFPAFERPVIEARILPDVSACTVLDGDVK